MDTLFRYKPEKVTYTQVVIQTIKNGYIIRPTFDDVDVTIHATIASVLTEVNALLSERAK